MDAEIIEACRWMRSEKGYTIDQISKVLHLSNVEVSKILSELGLGPSLRANSNNSAIMAARVAARIEEREQALTRVVDRDPCRRCGVRGDLHGDTGCRRYMP